MQLKLKEKLETALARRTQDGSLRTLKTEDHLLDFYSNDYLGFASSPELQRKIAAETASYPGTKAGSTGSRLLAGNSAYAMNLEAELAAYFGFSGALLFNSGFDANLALLSCIAGRGDTIIYDELAHSSMLEGARLSPARSYRFAHNDPESLRAKIKLATGIVFVAVESLYSMDGDTAPLAALAAICKEEGAHLIVDEAHSTGITGPEGRGLVRENELADDVVAVLYTFGKAMGTHGACLAGSSLLKQYLINFARPFIYSTALPFHTLASIRMALGHSAESGLLRLQLLSNISLFRESALATGLQLMDAQGPIQGLLIPGNEACKEAARCLQEAGFGIRAILHPTVALGQERLRICIHAFNSAGDIIRLTALLATLQEKV